MAKHLQQEVGRKVKAVVFMSKPHHAAFVRSVGGARTERYLRVCRWAMRRYSIRNIHDELLLPITEGGKPLDFKRIENLAFDRYILGKTK